MREELYAKTPSIGEEIACSKQDPNNIREIHIQQLDNGYIVSVGCKRFAIEKAADLINNLAAYISDPGKVEDHWYKNRELQHQLPTEVVIDNRSTLGFNK